MLSSSSSSNTDPETGCYYCTVGDVKHKGNTHFKHVNGCIEYDHCTCNCDGSWNCPGEYATDTCRTNPDTGCYYCEVHGKRYEGNSYFQHTNGCIEYNCVCNCDGSWDCPGERARDLCRQNLTTECYYCEVDDYLYQGNSQFDLVRDCYKYPGCTCACDGGWTCAHTRGEYVCDPRGREQTNCNICYFDGKVYRGNSMFSLDKECVKYICTCDCAGRFYCPSANARKTCENGNSAYFASISYGVNVGHAHTRAPRQVSVDTECSPCQVSDTEFYQAGDQFSLEIKCNRFQCFCKCDGTYECPSGGTVNICKGSGTSGGSSSSRGSSSSGSSYRYSSGGTAVSGGGGIDATSAGARRGSSVTAIGRGTLVNADEDRDTGVSVCRNCEYLGVKYEGNRPFTFEKGCFQYNCFCACNGSFNCPSERSEYICEGRRECVRCDLTDYDGSFKEPNTNFQIRRGCELFEKCRCNCDGGWSCDDGVYTCELKSGCEVDGNRYAEETVFELTRGCDKYKDCYCHADGRWTCAGKDVEDLCGQCRKCKIGDNYYDGDTTFSASVNCTRYSRCACNCDGSYECRGGRFTCDSRGDQPPEGQCTDCIIDGRRYRQGQSFDYTSSDRGCLKFRGCECRCGETTCREVDDTCGDCRSCNVDGVDYAGGTQFRYKQGCYEYSRCECNCNGRWECFGDSAKDTCNTCRKCNVDGKVYDTYSKFKLDRKCWNYQCFCLCNGTTFCPSATVVNTCNEPDRCQRCDVEGRDIRGNTHFTYQLNGMDMYCRCNCDGSYVCIAEWMYIREDVSISGTGIGSDVDGCFTCLMDGRTYKGDTRFIIARSGITLDCKCHCNGGYYCYGETTFQFQGCRSCYLYGQTFNGDTSFPLIYNGLKVACQCKCDGGYVCYGAESETVITCIGGSGCLPSKCGQCIVDGVRFNGLDQFGTVYRGQNLRCDCGCDGSYYCEGSGGIIISCVRGRGCVELGCSSCEVFGNRYNGGSAFELYYKGLKLGCQCECGGNYQCFGSNREVIVSCIDGNGCLSGSCRACVVNNRRYNGMTTFRYDYNGIDMLCTCACDGSYYCEGVTELIQISCIGGQCTRLGCASCNVFGLAYEGDSTFDLIYSGLKLKCQCSCDSGYVCYGSSSTAIVTCRGGRGSGCLPSTCSSCLVNNREYAGRSTFRSSYKGIDIMCTCGCDGTSYCVGITASIEVTCTGNTCTRIGCKECNIFGREYIGGSQFAMIYQGLPVTCDCDCDGGYICKGSRGITIITCVNGVGPGCLLSRCSQCEIDGRRYDGASKFRYVYQGIDMDCTCSCDSSYYCEGVREEIQISCYGGKCTTIGCKTCNIFGQNYDGASNFNIVYAGLLLDCQCGCDGSYTCRGEQEAVIIQCLNGRGNCLDQSCRTCQIGGQTLAARSTSRVEYDGYDLNCICGCDGSVYCTGISTEIIITCIGGKCSPLGCTNCRVFGEEHRALSAFNIIYSGYRLDCRCDCNGGYHCEGTVNLDCRNPGSRDCLIDTCNSCLLDGKQYRGNSVFKYDYNGIDMACTCGCDGSVFCQGVTEIIEIRCIGSACSPIGCRTCRIFDRDYAAFTKFDIIYQGIKLDCKCACDSSYFCIGSSGERVVECEAGRNCLSDPCRKCVVNGRRYNAYSTFPHKYKNIDMECRCGCDGTAYCEGTEEIIYVSCIGDTCSQLGCQTCSIFGNSYQGDSSFDIVYKGVKLDCTCSCDSSYRCIGKSPDDRLVCPAGQTCVADRCKKCRVNGKRYSGGQSFEFDYQGIRMSCVCGCDGTYFCRGISIEIEFSCFRRGGCKQIGGCRSCNIFGVEYAGGSRTDFVYQGYFMNCECNCDSSYKCLGTKNEVIIECSAGRDCLDKGCGTCRIDGREFQGNTEFDYLYNGKDMRCTCGCDGSYYCRCKDDDSEISCNRRGSCTWIGCNTCLSDGTQRQAYEEFEKYYDNIRMNCLCSCDGSYRCQGVDRRVVIICTGESCNLQGCRTCLANGREYQNNDEFEIRRGSEKKRCTCRCDGTTDCTTVVNPTCVSCIIDGVTFRGHSRDRLLRGSTMHICDCYCNGTHICYPESRPTCNECVIGGRRYGGRTQFEAELEGTRMQCTCDCNGNFVCKSDFRTCTSATGCVENCRECIIDGQKFGKNSDFQANVFGSRMTCSCDCQGSFTCRSDSRTCTTSGCVDNCRRCNIDGQSFKGNTNFEANVFGLRMQCSCDCTGSFSCTSETRTCTASGCVDNCRRCNIDGQSFKGNTNFEANVFGLRMQCSCDCTGSFSCTSETRTCTASGCVDNCRRCNIDGQSFKGNTNFEANVFGLRMQCSCDCTGSFSCTSETRTCTASGCVDNCRRCYIDGQSFKGNSNFKANVFGSAMQCSCDCQGSFTCRSDIRTCTSSGCVDNCRRCSIDGQSFKGNTNFEANVFGLQMQCSCDCTGSFSCRSETRTCTSSGCVDNCRQCLIDGQRFQNDRNFLADVFGDRMQCSCDCSGSYTCTSSRQTCSSASGCIKSCRECTVNGRRYTGGSEFEAVLQGIRMKCSCDCAGSWVCRGGTYTCTSFGCTSSCQGCEIEGRLYDGNTRFEIFHNAYGIQMTCECECSGSYTCKGTKEVPSCVGSGCSGGGCNDCIINGVSYKGNSQFEAIIDGLRMQCTCSCSGGYRCTGTRTETECYGPGCTETGCSNCVIRGKTYRGNSQFQIDGDDGVRMKCMCDCDGRYSCKGEKTTTVCVGAGCEGDGGTRCVSCNFEGREYKSGSTFKTVRNGVNMDCTCACTGEVRCEGRRVIECDGPDCFTGCRRCVIDGVPYTGNTRFNLRKGNVDYSCICYCDGSYSCKGSTGFETSCVGESCAADQCRSCKLFDKEYQLDARFRLQKNGLIMNCVCECDGAYRCFSISGTCLGDDCDVYGCKSCMAEGKVFGANSQFELSTGLICTCQCNGEYTCRAKSLQVECVGSDCGVGSGCRKCNIDGDIYPGNKRFQIRKYGLLMQCACNCDSSYTCRGYQIISTGESQVGSGCSSCEINGRRYNGNTRFQVMINGERSVCSCDCDGTYSCQGSEVECRECVINGQRYASNSDFSLTQSGKSIRCRCDCSGNFICEGRGGGTCRGNECGTEGCNVCTIFGVRHRGNSKFTTDVGGIRMLCECLCTGEYTCKGYRQITNVILPAVEEKTCETCYVAGTEHPGNTAFKIQRGCFQIECICGCNGMWECPDQTPSYTCPGGGIDLGSKVTQQRYSIAGSHVFTTGTASTDSKSTLIYTGEETTSTVFGAGADCRSCFINEREYSGDTEFVLQDGCLRWTCACDCSGGWNCSAVTGSECDGPLSPFEPKQCKECEAYGGRYPPNRQFQAEDKCYLYTCTCNCDGSWECPRELTVQTCSDTSSVYDPEKGTCRQCIIGPNRYNYGDTFDLVDNCINYKCLCQCDGKYNCPASTGVRVCRTGSGSPGRPVTTGSNTVTQTGRTVVAIRPAGYGTGGKYSNTGTGTGYTSSSARRMYKIQASGGSQGHSGGSYSSSSHTASSGTSGSKVISSSTSGSDGQVDLTSLLSGNDCKDCIVNGEAVRGRRYFTYISGCIEHLCDCFCNGTHFCDPDKQINFCELDRARASNTQPKGCRIGNRTYKTALFSYEKKCKKYYCRCFDDGTHFCDEKKTRKVC
ncbi:uncharacterized protein LOC123542478 [Mercenaria mercenaria]|uniref:uncharacterized protein LOC123542478 n=1 Tax=Mercenaria mercenaria TaxID=6596 RepID=UPI00234E8B20|nr:uncharacterized protein LOC123542478 [Mercenaria mercenaria]